MVTAPDILEVAYISCYIDCIGEDISPKKRILGDNGFWCNNRRSHSKSSTHSTVLVYKWT